MYMYMAASSRRRCRRWRLSACKAIAKTEPVESVHKHQYVVAGRNLLSPGMSPLPIVSPHHAAAADRLLTRRLHEQQL